MFKKGDVVKVNIDKERLIEIINKNKHIVDSIIDCYKADYTFVTQVIKGTGPENTYYTLNIGKDPVAWKENELIKYIDNNVRIALLENGMDDDVIKNMIKDDVLLTFDSAKKAFQWFMNEDNPCLERVLSALKNQEIIQSDVGKSIEDTIYSTFLEGQTNYIRVNDGLHITWWL